MSFAERVNIWNRRYEQLPSEWRFQFVLWAVLALGALNMWLTIVAHVPFGLLLLLGILAIALFRVPYVLRWVPTDQGAADEGYQAAGPAWMIELNQRYEAMPENRRMWVYPVVLLVAGVLNMLMTIYHGFPFGLLFLLALLGLVLVRAPYTQGWVRGGPVVADAEPDLAEVVHAIEAEPAPVVVAHAEHSAVTEPDVHATPPERHAGEGQDEKPA